MKYSVGSTLQSSENKTYLDRGSAAAGGCHDIHIRAAIAGTLCQVEIQFLFIFQVAFAVLQRGDADDDGAGVICTKHALPPAAQGSVHQHLGTRLAVLSLQFRREGQRKQSGPLYLINRRWTVHGALP